ncbi:MAG TPA: D-hexose-6-phosphate mutarotase [Anaerolineales bacterium]
MNAQHSKDELFPDEITLSSMNGDIVRANPYGAHVVSWVSTDGQERLFLSSKSEFKRGAAIRGGVPIIFPQFGAKGDLPRHGFARTLTWEVARVTADQAVFRLSKADLTKVADDKLLRLWSHHFLVEYSVRVEAGRLELSLIVKNTGQTEFNFTAALHTYLRVGELSKAAVSGLQGLVYQDNASDGRDVLEDAGRVTFGGEVDRLYLDVPADLKLTSGEREVNIHAEGFPDAVVWNPGKEKSAKMADMEQEGYLHFVCVEAAVAGRPVSLKPGGTWQGRQVLSI